MMTNTSLYDDVVTITYDYLGPAADRFVVTSNLQTTYRKIRPNCDIMTLGNS